MVQLLRIDDVAKALNVSRAKAYALAAEGTLPTVRLGRAVRVPANAFNEWVQAQVVGGENHDEEPKPRRKAE